MDPVDDEGIVAELRADRTQGFSLLYEAYAERLFAYAITVTRDRELAADVAHNAMIRAVDGIGKLRDPELLRPWLFRITRNEAISALRKGNRWSDDESAIEELASEPDFDQNLKAEDAQQLVSAAMQGLSPVDRDVLALALRKDLSTQDVAAAMGTSTNQASARLSRAKNALTNAVTAVVLCRQRRSDCHGLAEAMADYSGTLNPLTRKRITKHVRDCTTCAAQGRRRARQYVAGFTLPIAIAAAAGFRAEAQAALTGEIGALGATDEAGFPVPQDAPGAEELLPLISSEGMSEDFTPGEGGAQTGADSNRPEQADGDPGVPMDPGGDAEPEDFTLETMFLDPNEQPTEVIDEPAQGLSRAGWLFAGAGVLVLLLLVGMGIAIQQSADEAPSAAVPDAAVQQALGQATDSGATPSASEKKRSKKERKDSDETRSPTPSASATSSSRPSSSPTSSARATPNSTGSTSEPSSSTKPSSTRPDYSSSPSQVSKPTSEPTASRPTAKPTSAEPKPTTAEPKPTIAEPKPTSDYRTPSYSSAPKPTQSSAPTAKDPVPSYSAGPASTPKSTATSGGGLSSGSGN